MTGVNHWSPFTTWGGSSTTGSASNTATAEDTSSTVSNTATTTTSSTSSTSAAQPPAGIAGDIGVDLSARAGVMLDKGIEPDSPLANDDLITRFTGVRLMLNNYDENEDGRIDIDNEGTGGVLTNDLWDIDKNGYLDFAELAAQDVYLMGDFAGVDNTSVDTRFEALFTSDTAEQTQADYVSFAQGYTEWVYDFYTSTEHLKNESGYDSYYANVTEMDATD